MDIQENLFPDEVPPVFSLEHNQLLERVYELDEGTILWLYSGNRDLINAAMAIVDEAVSKIHPSAGEAEAPAVTTTGLQPICEEETEFDIDYPPVQPRWSIRRKPVPGPSDREAAGDNAQPNGIVDEAVCNIHGDPGGFGLMPTPALQPTCEDEAEFEPDSPPVEPRQTISREPAPESRSTEITDASVLPALAPTALHTHQPTTPSRRYHLKHRYTTFLERHDLTASEHQARLFILNAKRRLLDYRLLRTLQQGWHSAKITLRNYKDRYTRCSRLQATMEHTPWVTYILDHHSPATLQTARIMLLKRATQEPLPLPSWDDALKLVVFVEEANVNRPEIVRAFHEAVRGMSMRRVDLADHLQEVVELFREHEDLARAVRGYWGESWVGEVGAVEGNGIGGLRRGSAGKMRCTRLRLHQGVV